MRNYVLCVADKKPVLNLLVKNPCHRVHLMMHHECFHVNCDIGPDRWLAFDQQTRCGFENCLARLYGGILATRCIQSPRLLLSASFPLLDVIVHDELRYLPFGLIRVEPLLHSSLHSKVYRPLLHLLIPSHFYSMIP